MELKYLQVVVMDNDEMICEGKTVGFTGTGEKRISAKYLLSIQELLTKGRLSVLEDFDAMCKADAFVGFTDDEWKAVKKFFEVNDELSGWKKRKEENKTQETNIE